MSVSESVAKQKGIKIFENFLNEKEESCLLKEIEVTVKKKEYSTSHYDKVIEGYREVEKMNWNQDNKSIFERAKALIEGEIGKKVFWLPAVHILDLEENGFISKHVDNIEQSGDIISGMCLLSSALMRLHPESVEEKDEKPIDLLLKRSSLYFLT